MKLLFVMRHSGYVRNFESTLRALLERGHQVHVAFQRRGRVLQVDPTDIAAQLAGAYPGFSYGELPVREDKWGLVGQELRRTLDYLRYLRPEYRDAPKLRQRARRTLPDEVLARIDRKGPGLGLRAYAAWLTALDRVIPSDDAIEAQVRALAPDVMAVTPLIEAGAPQTDYVRAARRLGIPAVLCVASWDNLTNKGLIHGPVDLVTVWNQAMKQEAVTFHGVPAGRVVVTGAAAFDHWFAWQPSTSREAFCARVGLPADRPYLLYLCSSRFIAPSEVPFVRRWLAALRQSSSPALRDVGVLVRPHPQNAEQWQGVDLGYPRVAVWPRAGAAPVDTGSRSEYFDSMHHSAAVVGINTTAEIESAIVGRRAFTVLDEEFRDTQEGTLHFHHLKERGGGLLRVAATLEAHAAHLDAAVRNPERERAACARFVSVFVRPFGLDEPATPRLVAALEQLATSRVRRRRTAPPLASWWAPRVLAKLAARGEQLVQEAAAAEASRTAKHAARARKAAARAHREAAVAEAPTGAR
jgi:hypothetical protein